MNIIDDYYDYQAVVTIRKKRKTYEIKNTGLSSYRNYNDPQKLDS